MDENVSCKKEVGVMLKVLPSFISDELYVIRAFNEKQEAQISEFIDNIEQHIEVAEVEQWFQISDDAGEIGVTQIEHISGISEEEYDIREMFTEIMPIYQRQAMLLTLWGTFECEMEKMFIYASGQESLPKKNKRDKISKFKHMITCLRKIGMPPEPTEEYSSAVKTLDNEVRLIRNTWAHDGGRDSKNKIPDGIEGILKKYSQIAISKEYIKSVVSFMHIISQELNTSVRNAAIAANNKKQADA
ncbi:hypothetical protein Q4498_05360 [Neptunomonas phycophila]|uniref:hypothetical protein n=2 Tax=Neptunomonas phycophila TaxID=1572645 RepID=UPI0026E2A024|nr:hypothetical protein [Neptunomonas phycophila]MDO6467537.1 hypothetical protein [Neptunomonas phycophila]